jgi:putative ABC transport system permease protein
MDVVAAKMLLGDRRRYCIIVFGIALSAFLMSHQLAVFDGAIDRTTSLIQDAHPDGIWVMDPRVLNMDDAEYLPAHTLLRVKSCDGVAWVSPLYKSQAVVRVQTGSYRQSVLIGVDDASLVGLPREMVLGDKEGLRAPDSIVVDEGGYAYLWPGEPLRVGHEVEINGCRAVVAGVCKASPQFMSQPVVYTPLRNALRYCPRPLRPYSYLLVEPKPGRDPAEVCADIERRTGLKAITGEEFTRRTRQYFLHNTAIMLNFAIVVGLGFIVGNAVAGLTFYTFVDHHLGQFANLKAMGLTNLRIARMIVVQAGLAWVQGFPLGLGLAAVVLEVTTEQAPYLSGFVLYPWVGAAAAAGTGLIMTIAGTLSLRRLVGVEAAIVVKE